MVYLNSGLWETDLLCHVLAHEYVRVASFDEHVLEDIQLCASERGALTTLFPETLELVSVMSGSKSRATP